MPRDTVALLDAPVRHPEEIAILDKMADLLATPERWCQESLYDYDRKACCAVGALGQAGAGDHWALRRLADIDDGSFDGSLSISAPLRHVWAVLNYDQEVLIQHGLMCWNDAPERTHADILDLIARARRSFE